MRLWGKLYYGWVMLLALSCTQVVSWGILYYSFSVFLKPIGNDLGWSRAAMTGAFSLALACSGAAGLFVGRWVDRHGPRLLMTAGSCTAALLLIALSAVHSLTFFYLIWAALGVAMAAIFYEPAFAAIATWFSRYRARALTIITFVGGFASVIFIPLISWLIRTEGWRTAFITLAIILAITTIPLHAIILRHRPQDLGLLPDGGSVGGQQPAIANRHLETSIRAQDAFHSASFRWLTLAFCLAFLANVAVTVHLIPYLTDHGFSTGFAATAAGLVGILALPGRLIFTPLGGRIPRRYVAAGIFLFQTVGLIVLVTIKSSAGVVIFVILFGIGFGAITPARAALVAEMYGPREYGTISGVLALFVTGARAAAPVSAGVLYTLFGQYEPVFWILIVISLLGMGAILLIERDLPKGAIAEQMMA